MIIFFKGNFSPYLLNTKCIQICSFFIKLLVSFSRNNSLLSCELWLFKLRLFKKHILHSFIIPHANFGSQAKTDSRWSVCSPVRSSSTDWSLLVMVCRVRITEESKVRNAWKKKYFEVTRRKLKLCGKDLFHCWILPQNGLWFYLKLMNCHLWKSVVAIALKHISFSQE